MSRMNWLLIGGTVAVAYFLFFMKKKHSYAPPGSFTMYYMNGCPHCETVMPAFQEFMSACGTPCRVVEASELNGEFEVKGYPTFVKTTHDGFGVECSGRNPAAWQKCINANP